jgi:hypothetical protein
VRYATTQWLDWFNNRSLHSVLDYIPPEEYESAYYAQTQGSQPAAPSTMKPASDPKRFRFNIAGRETIEEIPIDAVSRGVLRHGVFLQYCHSGSGSGSP